MAAVQRHCPALSIWTWTRTSVASWMTMNALRTVALLIELWCADGSNRQWVYRPNSFVWKSSSRRSTSNKEFILLLRDTWHDGRSLRNSELSSSSFPCVVGFISYHGWGWRFYGFVLSLALLFNIFYCIIIIIIFLSSLLRPVTGVIKLNPSIFSKVCLHLFSLLVGILESFLRSC
jgi:hypothetical protein